MTWNLTPLKFDSWHLNNSPEWTITIGGKHFSVSGAPMSCFQQNSCHPDQQTKIKDLERQLGKAR